MKILDWNWLVESARVQPYLEFKKSFFRAVPWFMQKWVHVKRQLESITISDPTAKMGDANENRQIILKAYMYSTKSTQSSCITLLAHTANFKIKSDMNRCFQSFGNW